MLREGMFMVKVDPRPSRRPTPQPDQSIDAGMVFDVMKLTVKHGFP